VTGKRKKIDWEAIKRDYRTGKFTDRELEAKYGIPHETIVRARTRDRKKDPASWPQDLSKAVREATNAALMTDLVTKEITKGQQNVTNTVLAAAELNKQVILKHRSDIEATRLVAFDLLKEVKDSALLTEEKELLTQILAGEGAEPRDEAQARTVVQKALAFGNRVASVKALAETFVKLQDSERKAFGLGDGEKLPEDPSESVTLKMEPGEAYKLMIGR
jgi:hypothetical protein